MPRRLFTCLALGSCVLALVAGGLVVRGRFASDYVKAFRWDAGTRRYFEGYARMQGGLLMLHGDGTTLAADADPAEAERRGGPGGRRVRWTVDPAARGSSGPWLWYWRATSGAHRSGVVNPAGLADDWVFEVWPANVAAAACVLPAAWAVARVLRRRRQRRRATEGHCVACGYDLRASPERCPECGTAVLAAG